MPRGHRYVVHANRLIYRIGKLETQITAFSPERKTVAAHRRGFIRAEGIVCLRSIGSFQILIGLVIDLPRGRVIRFGGLLERFHLLIEGLE